MAIPSGDEAGHGTFEPVVGARPTNKALRVAAVGATVILACAAVVALVGVQTQTKTELVIVQPRANLDQLADFFLANGGSTRFIPQEDASSNKITGNTNGTLTLDGAFDIDLTAAATAPDSTSWLLVDVNNVEETFDTHFTVTSFTESPAGTWSKTDGGNTYTFTENDGLLVKTAAAPTNTYANWLTTNAPATGFTTDSDNDGVANAVEHILGTNPNSPSTSLTEVSSTGSTTTYKHTLNPTIASDVNYSYEWTTDLMEWKASGESNTTGTTANITATPPAVGVVTVTTYVSSGPAAKLFTRIKVSNP